MEQMAAEILNSSSLNINDVETQKTMKSLVDSVIRGGDHQDHHDSGVDLSTMTTDNSEFDEYLIYPTATRHTKAGTSNQEVEVEHGSNSTRAAVKDNSAATSGLSRQVQEETAATMAIMTDLEDISMESARYLALTESLLVSRIRNRLLEVMEWVEKGAANFTRYRLGVLRRTVLEQSAILDCLLHRSGIMQQGLESPLAPLPSVPSPPPGADGEDVNCNEGDSPGSSSSSSDRHRRRQLEEIRKFLVVVKTAVFKIKESHCFRGMCGAKFVAPLAPANVLGPNAVVAGPARPQPPILAMPRPASSTSKADKLQQKGQKLQDSDIVETFPVERKRKKLDVHRHATPRLPVPVKASAHQDGQRNSNAQGDGHRGVNVSVQNPPVQVSARCWRPLSSHIALLRPPIGSEGQQPPPRPRMEFSAAAAAPPFARRLMMPDYRILMVNNREIFYPGSSAGNLWQSLEANSPVPRSILDKVDAW